MKLACFSFSFFLERIVVFHDFSFFFLIILQCFRLLLLLLERWIFMFSGAGKVVISHCLGFFIFNCVIDQFQDFSGGGFKYVTVVLLCISGFWLLFLTWFTYLDFSHGYGMLF